MYAAHNIHEHTVIEAKAGEIFDMTDICDFPQDFVILTANKLHQEILISLILHSNDNLVTLLPLVNKRWNQRRRILKIRVQSHDAVAVSLLKSVDRRTHLAKVAGIENRLDFFVLTAHLAKDRPGPVRRVIIDIYDLVIILRKIVFHDLNDRLSQRSYIFFFIICRHNDRYKFLSHSVSS